MKLKIIKGTNNVGKQLIEISTAESKIAVGFGEDLGTAEISKKINPMFEGLTCGDPSYDALFILRNPENCNAMQYTLKEVPIFLEKRVNNNYQTCADFLGFKKLNNIKEIINMKPLQIKDLEITYFLPDISNTNTSMLLVKGDDGKSVLISGDFRNFDLNYGKENLDECIEEIGMVDYWIIDGKYFGRNGPENSSESEVFEKLKNIMKFYDQVFVIQSETDLAMAKTVYEVAKKTKRIFIEGTFLANLTTNNIGSAPNPITSKKVYTYNPLTLDNKDFEFKKKYVTHFYIHSASNKMKKEKYVMNINTKMLQDMQVFQKEESMYDACIILAVNKKLIKIDKELEEFLNLIKDLDLDYYELYSARKS